MCGGGIAPKEDRTTGGGARYNFVHIFIQETLGMTVDVIHDRADWRLRLDIWCRVNPLLEPIVKGYVLPCSEGSFTAKRYVFGEF